ncbi:MAG: hypothetical protein KOO62_06180 [candidate division Zixibacteria bacterium]|nr:hypothetical protein [candidate division Zixibacteria bacterium]
MNRRLELISVLVVISLLVLVRLYHLEADPPSGLSASTDVYTDPAQYTIFARNYIQTGDFDPFDDYRRTIFLKSSVTALAVVVFKIMGVGNWSSNFVGFLYSLGALLLFFLFIRRIAGVVPGLLFLLLAGLNYNLLFYGRLPFLEHSMAFFVFLALVLVTHSQKTVVWLLAGISLGVGLFFGKAIGLVFLFPFVVLFIYELLFGASGGKQTFTLLGEDAASDGVDAPRRITTIRRWLQPTIFTVGFVVVVAAWYFYVYAPMQSQVSGYFGEQAVSLYGSPDGLKSIPLFVEKLVTFGIDSKLFLRMWSVFLLSGVLIGMILYQICRPRFYRSGLTRFNGGHLFLVAMIVAFYGALMIWNYRPLRYQLVLVYASCGAAAIVLSMLWQKVRELEPMKTPVLFYPLCLPLVLVPLYQATEILSDRYGWDFSFDNSILWLGLVALLITVAIGLIVRHRLWRYIPYLTMQKRLVVILVVVVNIGIDTALVINWSQRAAFTVHDNSCDLGLILNQGAVVSGPLGPAMSVENEVGCVIHMFGVSQADPQLFDQFPITHLLLDKGNEKRARDDYSNLMDSAVHVLTYHVGRKKVRLFRIAGYTGNTMADGYRPSRMEEAIDSYFRGDIKGGHAAAAEFLVQNPRNLSGYLAVGTMAEEDGDALLAESCYKKAIGFSPTNYNLNSQIAEFYKKRYIDSADEEYKAEALRFYEEAMRLAPNVHKLVAAWRELKDNDTWQLKEKQTSSSQQ